MANKLLDKIAKNTTLKHTAVMSESKFFSGKEMI